MRRVLSLGLSWALASLAPLQGWATGRLSSRVVPGKTGLSSAAGAPGALPSSVPKAAPLASAVAPGPNVPLVEPPKAHAGRSAGLSVALPAAPASVIPAAAESSRGPVKREPAKAVPKVRAALRRIGETLKRARGGAVTGYGAGRAAFDLGARTPSEAAADADPVAGLKDPSPGYAIVPRGQEQPRPAQEPPPAPEPGPQPRGGLLARAEEGLLMAASTILPLIGTGIAYLAAGSNPLLYAGLLALVWFGGSAAMVEAVADARSYVADSGVHSHDQRYRVGMDGRLRDVRGHKAGVNDRWERREKGEVGRAARALAAAASGGIGLYFAAVSPAAALLYGVLLTGFLAAQAAFARLGRPPPPPPAGPSPR